MNKSNPGKSGFCSNMRAGQVNDMIVGLCKPKEMNINILHICAYQSKMI